MRNMTTTDLSEFGIRELKMTKDILDSWLEGKGLPEGFENEGVEVMFNRQSGKVFLTNAVYQVAMIDEVDGELKKWYTCPECGGEGFEDELLNYGSKCCVDYVQEQWEVTK